MAEPTPAKPPTLGDVARLAGVSMPTASRVLNGGIRGAASGSEQVRDRVRSAAQRLGYAPNPAAQTIKGGRSKTIALLVGDLEDQGAATMIAGVMHAAESRGLSVAVRATADDADRERAILEGLRGEWSLGIIVATSRTIDVAREARVAEQLQVLAAQGAKVVVIGNSSFGFAEVVVDNVDAASRLADGLAADGATKFAILAGPPDQVTSRDRVEGFLRGLERQGVDRRDVRVVHADFSRDGGYRGFTQIEHAVGELDVVAAMSDAMAVGAMVRARELGVSVPEDVEISGFDHVPMISDLLPRFSTVEIPLEQFGEAAVRLVADDEEVGVASVTLRAVPLLRGQRIEE